MRRPLLALMAVLAIGLAGCGVVKNVQMVPSEDAWSNYHSSVQDIEPGMSEESLVRLFDAARPGHADIGWIEPARVAKELKWPGVLRRMYYLGYYEPQLRGGYRDMPVTAVIVDNGVVTQVAVIE